MPYIDLTNPDFELDDRTLELLASQEDPPISVQQYVELKNLRFVKENQEVNPYGQIQQRQQSFEDLDKSFDNIEKSFDNIEKLPISTSTNANNFQLDESDLISGDISAGSALEEERNPLYSEVDSAIKARDQYLEENPGADTPSGTTGTSESHKQYQLLTQKIEAAEGRLERTTIDLNVPETFIGDYLGTIKKKFEEVYGPYGVTFSNEGFMDLGDTLTATLPGDIKLSLNTNPSGFFGSEKQLAELKENLGKLKDYKIGVQTGKEVVINGKKVLNTIDDIKRYQVGGLFESVDEGVLTIDSIKDHLEGTPYEVSEEYVEYVGSVVNLSYNGEVVATETEALDSQGISLSPTDRFRKDIIQNYLVKNLTKDETKTIRQSVIDLNNSWTEKITNERLNYDEVSTPIPVDLIGKTFVNDRFLQAQLPFFLKNKGLTDPEIKTILDHFKTNLQTADSKIKSKEIQISARETFGGTQVLKNGKTRLQEYTSLDGLSEELQTKLKTIGFGKLVEAGLYGVNGDSGIRGMLEDQRFQTIHDQLMADEIDDNQELIKAGETFKNTDFTIKKESLIYKKNILEKTSELMQSIPKDGMRLVNEILEPLGDKVQMKASYVTGQGSYYQLTTKQELTGAEQEAFDRAQVLLNGIQNTLQDLSLDKEQTITGFINDIVDLEESEKDQAILDKKTDSEYINSLMETEDPNTGENYTKERAQELLKKRKSIDINLWDTVYKEYGVGDLLFKDFGDAVYSIALAAPTIVGAEWAITEQDRLNQKNGMYMDMLTVDNMGSNKDLFAFRTLAQQLPNIILAIGTGAAGNALKLSEGIVKTAVASTFGITAGADSYRNLTLGKDLVINAKNQIKWLEKYYKEGKIDVYTYSKGMSDAHQAIATNDLSTEQIIGASIATGIVEGTITRFIGSGTNTMKILKDVQGSSSGKILNLIGKSKWSQRGLFGMEYAKRTFGELIEESAILVGTQAIAEHAILGRDFDLSQLDDTLMSTLITAGFSNGPSVAYSGFVNMSVADKLKKEASVEWNSVKDLKKALASGTLSLKDKRIALTDLTNKLEALSILTGEMAIDALAIGADGMKKLLAYQKLENELLIRAGVKPDTKNPNKVIGQYKRRKLTNDQAKAFESELNSVRKAMKDIRNSPKDYKSVKEMLQDGDGDYSLFTVTEKALGRLAKEGRAPKGWTAANTPRKKLAFIVNYITEKTNASNLSKVKKDSSIKMEWNSLVLKSKKEGTTIPDQEKWFKAKAQSYGSTLGTIVTTVDSSFETIKNLLTKEQLENVEYIEGGNDLNGELKKLFDEGKITQEEYQITLKELKNNPDVNGFVVGGRFVVNNVGDARAAIKSGDIRKALVVLHEAGHIKDDRFFGNTTKIEKALDTKGNPIKDKNGKPVTFTVTVLSERAKQYAENLELALNNDPRLKKLNQEIQDGLNQNYPDQAYKYDEKGNFEKDGDGNLILKPFKDRGDGYKDEYIKEAQTYLFAYEKDLQLETEEKSFGTIDNIIDKVFGGTRYNLNTPERALAYAVGDNAAARLGKVSEFTKRGIELQKKRDAKQPKVEQPISISRSQNISDKNKKTAAINTKIENRIIRVTDGKPDVRLGDLPAADQKKYKQQLTKNNEGTLNTAINIAISKIPQSLEASKRIPKDQIISQYKEEFSDLLNNYKPLVTVKGESGGRRFEAVKKIPFNAYMKPFLTKRYGDVIRKGKKTVSEGVRITSENVDKVDAEALRRSDKTVDLKERAAKEAKEVSQPLLNKIKSKNKTSLVSTITNVLNKEVQRRLPNVGEVSTVKTQSTLIKALTKGLQDARVDGKNIYTKVIDDIGGRNKTINVFDDFLSDNYSSLLEPGGLTTTYLSKAFPQAIEKYVVGEGWVKYPGWKGKKKGTKKGDIGFWNAADEGPYQGSTSGLQKIRRISNIKNTIPLAQFKGKYIDGINNKVKVAPTEALAKQILAEVGLDIFREEMAKKNSPLKDLFQKRQELLGATAVNNFEAQINKEIERPGIKFSLASLSPIQLDFWMDRRYAFYEQVLKLGPKELTKKTLETIHKEIYKDSTFSDPQHQAIADQFGSLLVPVTKADEAVFKSAQEFVDHLEDIAFTTDVNQSIRQFTGADKSISQMSNNYHDVLKGREFIVEKFTPFLIERMENLYPGFGEIKALTLLAAYAKSTFSQGSSKFGAFTLDKNNVIVPHGVKDSNRTALFGKADVDILKNLILGKNAEGIENFPNVKSIAKGKITFKDDTASIKIDINTSANVQMKYLKGLTKAQITKDKADAKLAREFTEAIVDSLKGENNNLTALVLATINSSSTSSLRLAAPVWGKSVVMDYKSLKKPKLATAKDIEDGNALDINGSAVKKVGDKMYTPMGNLRMQANYRYEHAVPARVVLWYLYDSKINKNKKINLDLLFNDYRVTIIPIEEMDSVITKSGFGSIMLANYIPGDQTWWKRYFNRFTKGKIPYALQSYETNAETGKPDIVGKEFQDYYEKKGPVVFKPNSEQIVLQNRNADISIANATDSTKYSKNIKGISVFDFDDTLARSKSKVLYTMPDGKQGKLSATEFAKDAARMEKQGVVWDFSEFSKVIKGKKGPLANLALRRQGKFGSENLFVLTARPQEAAQPIQQFLASIGLNIPIENITGLENGTPQAKADWMVNKFAEGYNDFYFTDDALKNVKAVKDVLDVLDVKSKVQQARVKFSKNLDREFNLMIERNKGIGADKRYSDVVAQRLGRNKKRWNFFIPPSADDFRGLTMYMFSGKGKAGEADMDFFNKSLILPYTRGVAALETAKQAISNDYRGLVRGFPKIKRLLRKKIKGTEFTHDEAVRIYLWDKAGYTIPGISKRDQAQLSKLVREDANLSAFADGVLAITKKEQYVEPSKDWNAGTIIADLNYLTKSVNRVEYLEEFNRNVDVIFSPENLNKIEAVYGTRVKEALIDTIQRMKTGSNRTGGKDRIVNKWNDWVNNSIGAIMFLNRRSALLQLISSVNFINWGDNNPAMAALAFSNQPQFWKDVVYLFNSDKLKQRRSGLKGDINEAEIAAAVKGARNKTQAFISVLLKYGFTFTQIADSVAIATGGAAMYRNRTNTYLKQGFSKAEAETKAFIDFSLISDESQQSADPMLISKQQAGVMGRLILAFQNTPMQYTRLMKKAGLDIVNGRGDLKTNISKIMYYGAVQNFLFSALQNALFALVPGFEDDDDELTEEEQMEAYGKVLSKKQDRILNGMLDTILRGSGLAGAVISTIKNAIRTYGVQDAKGYMADHTYTIIELANLSPPIGSKLRKIYSGIQTKRIERDPIAERGFDVTIDGKFNLSPSYQVVGDVVSGGFNIPLDRIVAEINAITEALDERNTIYQRIALALGFRTWDVNAKNEEEDLIKVAGKLRRKEEGILKGKATRKRNKAIKDSIYNALPQFEKNKLDDAKMDIAFEKAMKRMEEKLNAL
tara:strand:+ start:3164 stop:13450 length:10287 start_codon:yes stop_codon:yes gene_type:complete